MGAMAIRRPSLRHVLTRFHLRVAMIALGMAAIVVLVSGVVVLRGYANHNLTLVAQYSSYTVEPALVFNDPKAARDSIAPIAGTDGVSRLTVLDHNGEVFIVWNSPQRPLIPFVASVLHPEPARADVKSQGRKIGRVEVYGNGDSVAWFLLLGLVGTLVCLSLAGFFTHRYAQKLQRDIVLPLSAVSNVAHDVRKKRDFTLRAPRSDIQEIDSLGQDFNALLDELQDWQEKQQSVYAALEHQASHDPLTRLANRARFESIAGEAIKKARRYNESLAFLYLDGDGFKQINDVYGHGVGDRVLVEVGDRMRTQLRAGDIAARLGGDEFAVLVHFIESRDMALAVAERIRRALAKPFALPDGRLLEFSMSIGIAVFPEDGDTVDVLSRGADSDMYRRKKALVHSVRPSGE